MLVYEYYKKIVVQQKLHAKKKFVIPFLVIILSIFFVIL